ncbi:MAG: hypothetical protein WBS33_11165 [Verrucomicrobiia bacterium]
MNEPLQPKFIKSETLSLKSLPEVNEIWVQRVIEADPSILGLGEVVLKDRERIQPGAGRLDLLLQDADGPGRYEVEIQLGRTDESHIIRTIEYWDREKRRYPQYDHTAVIIAEEITSRFFNVIGLFNGFIPLMAIQMTAIRQADGIGVIFNRVLDTVTLGMLEEDEETAELTDRNFWESERGTPKTVQLADRVLEIVRGFIPNATPSYNKYYIGIWVDGNPCNSRGDCANEGSPIFSSLAQVQIFNTSARKRGGPAQLAAQNEFDF